MPSLAAVCQLLGHRTRSPRGARVVPWRRCFRVGLIRWALTLALALAWLVAGGAWAQGVELQDITVQREDSAIRIDYQLRLTLPRAVEDAALRGVPLYFVAQASLWRPRWYWRDERVARASREWRLSYQPLTSNWRISQGGLGQSFATLDDALSTMTRSAGWRIAEAREVEPDGRYYVEFNWRLDTAQLPRPMQIGLGGVGGASDWTLGVERSVRLP